MNVLQLHQSRTLAHVLLETAHAEKAWRKNWDGDCESELLDRLDALQGEARAMIETATGVSWAAIEGANL